MLRGAGLRPQLLQFVFLRNLDDRREIGARRVHLGEPGLEQRPPLHERQRAQVLALDDERVVQAHVGRELLELLPGHALAVEPLLQVVEGRDLAVAHHQQLAVEHRIEVQSADHVGKALPDIVAGARIQPRLSAHRHDLHADAVPFPLGRELGEIERGPVAVFQRVRQHQRAEHWRVGHVRLRCAPLQPREQRLVGRRQPVPDLLHVIDLEARHIGDGSLGQPRRHPHPQRAGQQLQQRPSPGRIQRIEPSLQTRPQIVAPDEGELRHDVGEARRFLSHRRTLPPRGGGTGRGGLQNICRWGSPHP